MVQRLAVPAPQPLNQPSGERMKCARCFDVEVGGDLFCTTCHEIAPSTSTGMRAFERRRMIIAKSGYMCQSCGARKSLIFHIEDSQAQRSWIRGSKEHFQQLLDASYVICNSCSIWDRQVRDGRVLPHGGGKTGRRNCRCELCGPLKNAWTRNSRQANKLWKNMFTDSV